MKNSSKDVLKKLEEWQREEAASSSFLESYKALLSIQVWADERVKIQAPDLSRRAAKRRTTSGASLIKFDEFKIDWSLANEIFKKVLALLSKSPELTGKLPAILSRPDFKLQKRMVRGWYNGAGLPDDVAGNEIESNTFKTILHATLKPFLTAYARSLSAMVEQGSWRKGHCPICGGAPDISFIEKEVGERWLMCSRCDAQWHFQRLECPNCGNQDHKSLSYLSDDTEVYRLYVCDKCHTYLKAVDLKKAKKDVCLPLERLLTFDMDVQGQEKGYKPLISAVI